MNLLKTERSVAFYTIHDEQIVGKYDIDEIPDEKLFTIVIPPVDDPLLCDGYPLNRVQFKKINDILKEKIIPDFNLYYYVLESTGIYDWDMKP
ncbi:MAG TPA: hypothetical protein VK772_07765 [Puia sp.]|jgi:hypothetical protein|nr:hypothetical protein [Puia sp.]